MLLNRIKYLLEKKFFMTVIFMLFGKRITFGNMLPFEVANSNHLVDFFLSSYCSSINSI